MDQSHLLYALLLTFAAGLSTGIGSLIGFFAKTSHGKFLSYSLGFSAGVMIYVSLVEIFAKARQSFTQHSGSSYGYLWTFLFFMAGILLIAVIDKLIPSYENPHEPRGIKDLSPEAKKTHRLHRMGIFAALAIAIHNFPEGIATFI